MPDGPSLETYIETRFNLLMEAFKDKAKAQDEALRAFEQSSKAASASMKAAVEAAQGASELRYQQRFEAQSDALAAAFQSQQQAMQTAFTVAEKAVQSALAAADRAVSKAELASDKRFEALNELRQMLNDMIGSLVPRLEFKQQVDAIGEKIEVTNKHIDTVEGRLNTISGERIGLKSGKDDTKAMIAMGISIFVGLITLISFAWRFVVKP